MEQKMKTEIENTNETENGNRNRKLYKSIDLCIELHSPACALTCAQSCMCIELYRAACAHRAACA